MDKERAPGHGNDADSPPSVETTAPRPRARRGRPTAREAAKISDTIIAAATKAFMTDGYDGTSIDAIATQAGVPRSTLYNRYRDKRELLKGVLAACQKRWSDVSSKNDWRLPPELPPRLQYYCATMLIRATDPEVSAANRLAIHAWPGDHERAERREVSGMSVMIALITEEIRERAEPGSKLSEEPEASASMLMAMLSGWMNLRLESGPLSPAEAEAASAYLVDIFLHGLA